MKRTLGIRQQFIFAAFFILTFSPVLTGCNSVSGSRPDTIPPTVPTNLTVTAVSATQIKVSWTASTDDVAVTGYQVQRCQGMGCSNFATIATPTSTTYNDMGLTAGTSYSYRVEAADAAGNLSGFSSVVSGATPAAAVSVSIMPVRVGAVIGQSVTFNASVQNDVGGAGVTWATSGRKLQQSKHQYGNA